MSYPIYFDEKFRLWVCEVCGDGFGLKRKAIHHFIVVHIEKESGCVE